MKNILLILFLVLNTPIYSQTNTTSSFLNVKNNVQKYINQPLGLLLSDIENDVKKASVIRPIVSMNRPSKFYFFSISQLEFDSLLTNRKKIPSIVVTVSDKLYYNYAQRGINEYKDWPKADKEKFKSIIVSDLYIID